MLHGMCSVFCFMTLKADRQNFILELISASRIERQDEVVDALKSRGFGVTQASVSRDLEELGVVKANGAYTQRALLQSFGLRLASIVPAGPNLLVARCMPGLASATAVRIDAAKIRDIVGTIAGDDTIFIAIDDEKSQASVIEQIKGMFEGME